MSSNIDNAVFKALRELERIENLPENSTSYQNNNSYLSNKKVSDKLASEIASEIADTMEKGRRKQVLKASITSLLKAGYPIQLILSIEGITEHFTIEEIISIKNNL